MRKRHSRLTKPQAVKAYANLRHQASTAWLNAPGAGGRMFMEQVAECYWTSRT